ncbi:hypothetical protein Barb4_04086 [Bacteroidales bacterium Barb4]|nr:hypothetical protein Barb4_04086 [Bacteroidales bacterium Barb4]
MNLQEKGNNNPTDFAGKKLLIPAGSFDQYYRYNKDCKFMGGNFLMEENNPNLFVVKNSDGVYQIKEAQLKTPIDSMKFGHC